MLEGGERESGRATGRSLSGQIRSHARQGFDSDEYFPALRTSHPSNERFRRHAESDAINQTPRFEDFQWRVYR